MKNADNAKQPAMPYCVQHGFVDYKRDLTKREMFAMAAMQGLCANSIPGSHHAPDFLSKEAVMYADALLAELERTK